jgi:hypothetical protein
MQVTRDASQTTAIIKSIHPGNWFRLESHSEKVMFGMLEKFTLSKSPTARKQKTLPVSWRSYSLRFDPVAVASGPMANPAK